MAVNLSVRQLRDNDLLDHVARVAAATGAARLGARLELTESMVMENLSADLEDPGRRCARVGVRISVDDFGTGYSSLATLDRLPVDEVKIDKSFIDGIADQRRQHHAWCRPSWPSPSRSGITTWPRASSAPSRPTQLQELGCDLAQGYLFSTPVSGRELPGVVEGSVSGTAGRCGPCPTTA